LVFLNTRQSLDAANNALLRTGIDDVPYHAKLKHFERFNNIQQFRVKDDENTNNVVLVCTDVTARKEDVPRFIVVVQLHCVTNVVTNLHRMGRCGCTGIRNGFSRKRGFTRKSERLQINKRDLELWHKIP